MGADNWGNCPKCKERELQAVEALKTKIKNSYGKIPQEKYIELTQQLSEPIQHGHTLREDYEVWMDDDGFFQVSYGCSCAECGFEFQFKHEETVQF